MASRKIQTKILSMLPKGVGESRIMRRAYATHGAFDSKHSRKNYPATRKTLAGYIKKARSK